MLFYVGSRIKRLPEAEFSMMRTAVALRENQPEGNSGRVAGNPAGREQLCFPEDLPSTIGSPLKQIRLAQQAEIFLPANPIRRLNYCEYSKPPYLPEREFLR